MYYFEDVVAEAAKEAGMRGVLGETIIGFPVPETQNGLPTRCRFTERYLARFAGDPLIGSRVAPHALYTNSGRNPEGRARPRQPVSRAAGDPVARRTTEESRPTNWPSGNTTARSGRSTAWASSTAAR